MRAGTSHGSVLTSPSAECLFSAQLCAFALDLTFCHSFLPSLHVNLPCRRATECSLVCHTSVLSMSMTKPQAYSRALSVIGPSCLPCRAQSWLTGCSALLPITARPRTTAMSSNLSTSGTRPFQLCVPTPSTVPGSPGRRLFPGKV